MRDWMSGPHAVRHSTAGPEPEPDPVEVTEPVDVVAWLRALPVGTVLLDPRKVPWAVHAFVKHTVFLPAHPEGGFYHSHRDGDMLDLAKYAPFRVLWMPPVGDAS